MIFPFVMQSQSQPIPAPVVVHFNHIWLVWLLYFWGQLSHAALQVDSQARKAKLTRRSVFYTTWPRIVYRVSISTALFMLVWDNPGLITGAFSMIGHPLGADETAVLAIPMNNALALLYGLLTDSLLGYVPFLKSQLPDLND